MVPDLLLAGDLRYEYPLNNQWVMMDVDDGYVLWTGIWKGTSMLCAPLQGSVFHVAIRGIVSPSLGTIPLLAALPRPRS